MRSPSRPSTSSQIAGAAPTGRRRWVLLLLVIALLAPSAAHAGVLDDAVAATDHTPAQFAFTLDHAILPGLAPIGPAPAITGDPQLDARIRYIAVARGYQRRAEPNRPLVAVGSNLLQPEAAAGWESLRVAAAAAGHTLFVTSGYRGVTAQASFLRSRLGNASNDSINRALSTVAAPGYSKHHTGYAIDVRSSTASGFGFRNSPAYAWLADNDFANAKAHGWIPSYPEGATMTGPIPEPWEFVWVGATNIVCGDYQASPGDPFCDTLGAAFASDIAWLVSQDITRGCNAERFCPAGLLTRGQAATMMWRMMGRPTPASKSSGFSDVPTSAYFAVAVTWMVENGFTSGTSLTTFSPNRPTTRAEFVTFLWRLAGRPSPSAALRFTDVDATSFAAEPTTWASETGITSGTTASTFAPSATATRGEASAFLHRFSRSVMAAQPESTSALVSLEVRPSRGVPRTQLRR